MPNTPIAECAKLFYGLYPNGNFQQEIGWYIESGAFRSDGKVAYLARAADTRVRESYAGDVERWNDGHKNAWFIAYAAGDIGLLGDALRATRPHYPYIIWGRSQWDFGEYKVVETYKFLKTIKRII